MVTKMKRKMCEKFNDYELCNGFLRWLLTICIENDSRYFCEVDS